MVAGRGSTIVRVPTLYRCMRSHLTICVSTHVILPGISPGRTYYLQQRRWRDDLQRWLPVPDQLDGRVGSIHMGSCGFAGACTCAFDKKYPLPKVLERAVEAAFILGGEVIALATVQERWPRIALPDWRRG